MKVFVTNEDWSKKLNVVDENNLLVGFDYSRSCCESFGYYFSGVKDDVESSSENLTDEEVNRFRFVDEAPTITSLPYGGGKAQFRLSNCAEEAWLTIYNDHNGYYGHGFSFAGGSTFNGQSFL